MTGHTCKGCGANIGLDDKTCPSCGHSRISKASTGTRAVRKGDERYRVNRERVRRPESGSGSIAEAFRRGGRDRNVQVCMKCRHVQSKIRDTCKECGSKLTK